MNNDKKRNSKLTDSTEQYKSYIGPGSRYDIVSAMQFNMMTFMGLREHHYLLDIGCGSLRAGKLFIPFLLPDRYFGIEPNQWLIDEGIKNELGKEILKVKNPTFNNNNEFNLTVFNKKFDYMIAQSIFSHASKNQIEKCFSESIKVMKPDSFFLATFILGEEDYKGDEWVYPGCVFYTMDYIVSLGERFGMACEFLDWPHPNKQSWFVFTFKENKKNLPHLKEISDLFSLKDKLRVCSERLKKYDGSRYVKFGISIRKILKKLFRKN